MVRLVRPLRECPTPGDESAVEQIVTNLLVEPAISQQAVERNYGALLGSVGLCSIVSLESMTRQDLLDAGVQHGHAMPVLRALQTLPVAIPVFSPPPGAPPEPVQQSVAEGVRLKGEGVPCPGLDRVSNEVGMEGVDTQVQGPHAW